MKRRRGLRDQFDLGLCLYWLAPVAVGNPRSKLREKSFGGPNSWLIDPIALILRKKTAYDDWTVRWNKTFNLKAKK